MFNKLEKEILKKIAESQLVSKPELKKHLDSNGLANSFSAIDTITRRLVEKKFITTITPVGSTCYIITQKGVQELKDME
ncbi:MAG: hypothetical protein NT120_00615 [Candidatus Aenigmarchaeota archaeon]|nr:hypothetical protein [Candidatus Aenigmarchaeota archaeon]